MRDAIRYTLAAGLWAVLSLAALAGGAWLARRLLGPWAFDRGFRRGLAARPPAEPYAFGREWRDDGPRTAPTSPPPMLFGRRAVRCLVCRQWIGFAGRVWRDESGSVYCGPPYELTGRGIHCPPRGVVWPING